MIPVSKVKKNNEPNERVVIDVTDFLGGFKIEAIHKSENNIFFMVWI